MSASAFRPVQLLRKLVPNVRRNPKDAFLIALVVLLAALLLVSVTGGSSVRVADPRSPTAGGAGGQAAPAAQLVPSDASSPAAPSAATFITCTPNQVMNFKGRVHVHCSTSFSGISYFALSTADPSNAARVLSVASAALVSGRQVTILYDPADLSGAAIGCLNVDCRLIIAIGM